MIVALDEYPGARMVCSREWLYTAISRAKSVCLLVGKRPIADSMCLTRAIQKKENVSEGIDFRRCTSTEANHGCHG